MKNVLLYLPIVILIGCSPIKMDYTCFGINEPSPKMAKNGVDAGDMLCVNNQDLAKMNEIGYSNDKQIEYFDYVLENGKFDTRYNSPFEIHVFVDMVGNIIPYDVKIHSGMSGQLKHYENMLNAQEEEKRKAEEDAKIKREFKATETKYGAKFCSSGRTFDCLIELPVGRYKFMQHIDVGTLIRFVSWDGSPSWLSPHGYWGKSIYLIDGETDKYLTYNQYVSSGIFKVVGQYSYTSMAGIKETVIKIKRLSN